MLLLHATLPRPQDEDFRGAAGGPSPANVLACFASATYTRRIAPVSLHGRVLGYLLRIEVHFYAVNIYQTPHPDLNRSRPVPCPFTVPSDLCTCVRTFRFDFTTEVSGFFVRRLSQPSGAAAASSAADSQAGGESCPAKVASDPVDPEPVRDAGGGGGGAGPPAESETEASIRSEVLHNPPDAGSTVRNSARGHADGGPDGGGHGDGGDGGGDGGARNESAAEGTGVLAESGASKALWKRARPRVRYFTHQVGRKSVFVRRLTA